MVEQKCIVCKKSYKVFPNRIKRNQKFCSQKCYGEYYSKHKSGKNHPKWKRIEKNCQVCNRKYSVIPSRIKGKFCSRKCANKGISQNKTNTGENSPCWKGGTTPIRIQIINSLKYKQWRQSIFIRDDFTCQKCGIRGNQTGAYLEAHHIKSFSKLLQEVRKYLPLYSLYEGTMIYTPFWDIDNGIILCKKCHKQKHKKRK